ncbi:MAG: flagellar motor switch protein FliM [candidate division Zixibacteria bacterium]|nr:flagellar motor switch protein FliM [candidate division Zixibacteria bacterium]
MAKILSQNEIDALLNQVSASDEKTSAADSLELSEMSRKAIAYDFKHPNRVSKDQMRTLESLHSNFAGHFGSALSGITRSVIDIDLLSVDQITYSEFIMSLVSPSCTYVFSLAPLEGGGILDFNPSVVFSFVDRMFGGLGKSLSTERELTGIEKALMTKISNRGFKELEKAWAHIQSLQIKMSALESNPQFIQIVPPGETVIVISLQMKMQATSGIMTICYPYLTLESIVGKLSAQNWIDKNKKMMGEDDSNLNKKRLAPVTTDIKAILGNSSVSIRDLLSLEEGDVLRINKHAKSSIDIYIGDKIKFQGKPGKAGKQMAVKINSVF